MICCGVLICIGFMFNGHLSLYFNLAALCIVIGGTLGATLISFKIESLVNLYHVLKRSNRTSLKKPEEIVQVFQKHFGV